MVYEDDDDIGCHYSCFTLLSSSPSLLFLVAQKEPAVFFILALDVPDSRRSHLRLWLIASFGTLWAHVDRLRFQLTCHMWSPFSIGFSTVRKTGTPLVSTSRWMLLPSVISTKTVVTSIGFSDVRNQERHDLVVSTLWWSRLLLHAFGLILHRGRRRRRWQWLCKVQRRGSMDN